MSQQNAFVLAVSLILLAAPAFGQATLDSPVPPDNEIRKFSPIASALKILALVSWWA
jgi:hypothetical protein